jgi:hypothetical protein
MFKFENEKWRKIPEFFFPVTSENEKNTEISAKFDRKVEPWTAGSFPEEQWERELTGMAARGSVTR